MYYLSKNTYLSLSCCFYELNKKLNAITRLVVLLIFLSYFYFGNFRILLIGLVTIFAIFLMHYFHMKEKQKRESKRIVGEAKEEGFESPALDYLKE